MNMEQLHAHEVLHMMEGNSYSEDSLKEAIIKRFGEKQTFYACSAEDMDIDELIMFLKARGKFMPANDGFTVDISKVCNH
jgi:probable metal-binding protein